MCMTRQQLWQACRKVNNNRQSPMTHSARENETSCSTLAPRVACCTLDFGPSCQIAFGIPQTPRVDSRRPADITLITETFIDITRRMATGCEQLWLNVRGRLLLLNVVYAICVSGWHTDRVFRKVRPALLTLHICMKHILAENILRGALQISANIYIGSVGIWKMPTFFLD